MISDTALVASGSPLLIVLVGWIQAEGAWFYSFTGADKRGGNTNV